MCYNNYIGTTPKPLDFDVFWATRQQEALQSPITFSYSLCFKSEGASYYELTFTGITGCTRFAKMILPNDTTHVPLVLQFHGYPGSSRSYFELSSFVGANFGVIAFDCPGQGGKGQDVGGYEGPTVCGHLIAGISGDPKEMYYVRLFQDMIILCEVVKQLQLFDLNRVYVNGASQGGALALACTALNPLVKKCVTLYPFLSDYEAVCELNGDTIAYEGLRYYLKWNTPDGAGRDQFFNQLGYIDMKNFASMIRVPVLFGTGLRDDICPVKTQYAVYNALTTNKVHYVYPEYGHEEIGHFDDLIINFLLAEVADE